MAIKEIFMVPPTYCDIHYSINPWMGESVDKLVLEKQWQALFDTYVKILGKKGIMYFSLVRTSETDFSQKLIFQEGLKNALVDFELIDNDTKMIVVTPIFAKDSKRNSEPIGVVIAKMRTADFDEILLNRSVLGKTGQVYIVNEDSLMISESRFIENAAFNQRVETIPIEKCLNTGENILEFYKGEMQSNKKSAVNHDIDWGLLDFFSHFPPCSGVALGIDRLLMILYEITHIKEVIFSSLHDIV